MKKKILYLIILFFQISILSSQIKAKTEDGKQVILNKNGTWFYKENRLSNIEIPKANNYDITYHVGYSLFYSEKHEQSKWVAYELTKLETNNIYPRTNKFLEDPKILSNTANNNDYSGTGYDRGHLAPASDMGWSEKTMSESFYYSNISPQTPSFNRGIWKKLESQVRKWANDYNSIYVVTGPVLVNNLNKIGFNNVSIPKEFYKVILYYDSKNKEKSKAIGFILPNTKSTSSLKYFATSINSVEEKTDINFFFNLPDDIEESIESEFCLKCWNWDNSKTKTTNKNSSINKSKTVRCSGITKSGKQCKRMTKNSNGRCSQH